MLTELERGWVVVIVFSSIMASKEALWAPINTFWRCLFTKKCSFLQKNRGLERQELKGGMNFANPLGVKLSLYNFSQNTMHILQAFLFLFYYNISSIQLIRIQQHCISSAVSYIPYIFYNCHLDFYGFNVWHADAPQVLLKKRKNVLRNSY